MEKHVLYPTDAGTPQGGIISPVLTNLTLDGLELLPRRFPGEPKRGTRRVNMVRCGGRFDDHRDL